MVKLKVFWLIAARTRPPLCAVFGVTIDLETIERPWLFPARGLVAEPQVIAHSHGTTTVSPRQERNKSDTDKKNRGRLGNTASSRHHNESTRTTIGASGTTDIRQRPNPVTKREGAGFGRRCCTGSCWSTL